jgi:hypothetical protein
MSKQKPPTVMHVTVTTIKTKPRKMTFEVTTVPMFDEKKIRRTIADCEREIAAQQSAARRAKTKARARRRGPAEGKRKGS